MAVDTCRVEDRVAQADLLGFVEHTVVLPFDQCGSHGFDDLGVHDRVSRAQDAPELHAVAEGGVLVDVAQNICRMTARRKG